ncbi:MAG TPA: chloride channel protein [Polyangia bacterium]
MSDTESEAEVIAGTVERHGKRERFFLARFSPHIILGLDAKLLLLVCTVGALAGAVASVYAYALNHLLAISKIVEGHVPVYLLMAGVGVLVGLCYFLGHPGETDAVVDNIHMDNGRMDTRANLPLVPCSLLSIAAGGSAGPEAPMVYLTGSVGTWLHRWFKLPEQYVRTLTLTGMGVGFATLFGAPVGSAIFALEIPHKRGMEYYEATVPAIIGVLVGTGIFSLITGHSIGPTWHFPAYNFHHVSELAIAVLIGLACGLASLPYVGGIQAMKKLSDKIKLPMWIKGAVGGLILGLIAWKLPDTRFWGEEQLTHALLEAKPALELLLILAAAKMFTVAVTLAAGWKGGIIIPCFFIGACLGKAISLLFPSVDPSMAMLCGMAAVNVSVMKVPLATILVVSGMSGIAAIPVIAAAAFGAFVVTGGIEFLDTKRERTDVVVEGEVDSAASAIGSAD